jgi:hypothetical protein
MKQICYIYHEELLGYLELNSLKIGQKKKFATNSCRNEGNADLMPNLHSRYGFRDN